MNKALKAAGAALAGLVCASLGSFSAAQTYPVKPVRVIVNYTPGGPADPTADAQVIKVLDGAGFGTASSTREYVSKRMRDEYQRWKKAIADARIVPE